MKYIIRGKNIEVTPAIRDKITKSMEKLNKYKIVSDDVIHVEVRTYKENLTKVRVSLDLKGKFNYVQAEAQHVDLYAAIESARHKLEEQLRKMKDRWVSRGKERVVKELLDPELNLDEEI